MVFVPIIVLEPLMNTLPVIVLEPITVFEPLTNKLPVITAEPENGNPEPLPPLNDDVATKVVILFPLPTQVYPFAKDDVNEELTLNEPDIVCEPINTFEPVVANPNAVICAEPLTVPVGIEADELTNPNPVICAEEDTIPLPFVSYEDVAAFKLDTDIFTLAEVVSKLVILIPAEAVVLFKFDIDVFTLADVVSKLVSLPFCVVFVVSFEPV